MTQYYNASLRDLAHRLRSFRDNLSDTLEDIVRDKEEVIVSTVIYDQLYTKGIDGSGREIMSYEPYKMSTIANKRRKGQPTTRVTLRDTGQFYRAAHLVFTGDGFYVTSDDPKTEALKEKYGNGIFRLTDRNFNEILNVHIRRELIKRLKRQLR